jgi:heptosyltransferase-2
LSKQRVLIIAPNWIGDAVMSLPLIKKIKDSDCQIDVLVTPWVAPVYEACEDVNQVISGNFLHGKLQLPLRWKISRLLKKSGYSSCYILPNSWKSLIIPIFAGISKKIAYVGESRTIFLSRALPNPDRTSRPSMVGHYLSLASEKLSVDSNNLSDQFTPHLTIKPHILIASKQVLANYLPNCSRFFILAPGAEFGPAKQWPSKHFGNVANLLLDQYKDSGILILGSKKDSSIADQILYGLHSQHLSRIQNLCGKIPLIEAMGLLSMAKGLISNDSGMMHIGAALQIPQIAIFGSSDPSHTPPLSKKASIMYLGLDCSPCHQRKCPLGHTNCLVQISPDSVFKQFNIALATEG